MLDFVENRYIYYFTPQTKSIKFFANQTQDLYFKYLHFLGQRHEVYDILPHPFFSSFCQFLSEHKQLDSYTSSILNRDIYPLLSYLDNQNSMWIFIIYTINNNFENIEKTQEGALQKELFQKALKNTTP